MFSPGRLLDPRHEVVPFHGRVAELRALRAWRDGAGRKVLLLHGRAGVGKTRLARRLDGVEVVDDADLVPWPDLLRAVRDAREPVLLVARSDDWWWSAIRQRAADLGYRADEHHLRTAPEGAFRHARAAFARELGRPEPDEDAGAPTGTTHDLHLAALAAVLGTTAADPVDLVRRLAAADPDPVDEGRFAEDVLAVALLDERIEPEKSPRALETLARAAGRWPHVARRAAALFVAEPDLAARASSATLRVVVEDPDAAKAVARHVFNDTRFHCDPLPAVLTRTLLHDGARTADPAELAELYGMLGARAALAALKEEALDAAREEVALYRDLARADPAEYRAALAESLADLVLAQVATRHPVDALATSEEAVALYTDIAAQDDDYAPRLAHACEQLGIRHAALEQRDEALAAVDRASRLYQELAKRNPALFRPDFAKVSHHLAIRLFDVGRSEEAHHSAHWAVVHWRAVAESDPRYEPEFARTLAAVATLLAARAAPSDAVALLEESIAVLRRLADANPRVFESDLADALCALGSLLRRAGHLPEARKASEEGVRALRGLAAHDPSALRRLAVAVDEQADLVTGPERTAVAEEAVDLVREHGDATALGRALHRRAGVRGEVQDARTAVLLAHLTGVAGVPLAETLSRYATVCAAGGHDLDRALVLAHRAVLELRRAGAGPDRFTDAVDAVEDVIRAHPDQESARARMQRMVVRDWPGVSPS
ncbi:hypothetical protein [Actinosynnema sp. NPDC020468]|uniref:hypothetical protein n=1 Tax=Actinosynnema sp. NPDC020468 TaxID=3154488 RepID=UPI0033CFE9EC